MTDKGRLPADAFEYYVGLGDARSYHAVGQHYGVSKRAVTKRAKQEDWQQRIRGLQKLAQSRVDAAVTDTLQRIQTRHLKALTDLKDAAFEIVTPERMKVIIATLFQMVVKDKDAGAARVLFDRLLGRARVEPLPGGAIGISGAMQSPSDVLSSVNALLQAVAEGRLSPEDAQKTAGIVDAARKAIETEDLSKRVAAVEKELESRKGSRP